MIKVEIKNGQNQVTHFAHIEDQAKVDAWLADQDNISAWGGEGNYTVTQTDVTAEFALRNLAISRGKDAAMGKVVANKILALAASKNLTDEQIDALYADATISKIRAMLTDGALRTARRNLNSADVSAFLTADEKTAMLAELDAIIG